MRYEIGTSWPQVLDEARAMLGVQEVVEVHVSDDLVFVHADPGPDVLLFGTPYIEVEMVVPR